MIGLGKCNEGALQLEAPLYARKFHITALRINYSFKVASIFLQIADENITKDRTSFCPYAHVYITHKNV